MAISPVKVPPLIDLQVLSPLAWIRRENDRRRLGNTGLMSRRTLVWYLKEHARLVEGALPDSESVELTEEQRRAVEWHLIQSAALATRWIESMRSNDYTNKTAQEPTNG